MITFLLKRLYPYPDQPRQTREVQVLLLACQVNPSKTQEKQLRDLIADAAAFDWEYFVDLALEHRVFPLVFWNLQQLQIAIPHEASQRLHHAFAENFFTGAQMCDELIRVIQALGQQNIAALSFRGPVLAQTLYPQMWMREFKDIDVLVDKRDFERAEAVFFELGYVRDGAIEDNAYNQKLLHAQKQIEVELHWALDSPFMPVPNTCDVQWYWQRSIPVIIENTEMRALCADDLLFMLAFHGAKHRWSRLKWLYDISTFMHTLPDFDWRGALQTARAFGIERILLLTLHLTEALFQTPLPAVVKARLRQTRVIDYLGRYMQHWLFNQREANALEQIRGIAFFLLIRERPRDRIPSIRHALQHPKAPLMRRVLRRAGSNS